MIAYPIPSVGQALPNTYPSPIDRGNTHLEFTPADSTAYPDPPSLPDAISSSDYAFVEPPSEDVEAGGVWKVALIDDNPDLAGDDTVYVDPKAHSSTPHVSFALANYYPEHELLLFKSRQNEYSRYMLVARATGEVTVAFGSPVFSTNGEWFLTMGHYTPSGWSPQGLQLFSLDRGRFAEVIRFRTGDVRFANDRRARQTNLGGPSRARWMDEHTFQLEMLEKNLEPGQANTYEHYRVDIHSAVHDRSPQPE